MPIVDPVAHAKVRYDAAAHHEQTRDEDGPEEADPGMLKFTARAEQDGVDTLRTQRGTVGV